MGGDKRNPHVAGDTPPFADDPAPPYTKENHETALSTDEKRVPSDIADRAGQTAHTIPAGRWDLACSIDVPELLQLNAMGEPTWTQDSLGDPSYRRDGFSITLSPSAVSVTNGALNWTCDVNTNAGQLLMSKRDTVSLRNLWGRLLVFERTIMMKNRTRPPPKLPQDPEGCLKIESQSPNIWTITGTAIYQVEGHENDVAVQSLAFLRLWDMTKGKFRWEKKDQMLGTRHIWGFTEKYIVTKAGCYHLRERNTGNNCGTFDLPQNTAFIDFNEKNHFGPMVTTGGLFLHKPCRRAIVIFQVGNRQVNVRTWEATDDIQGTLLLRGELENLELELIGQEPTWTKYEATVPVYWFSFIGRRMRT